MKIEETVTKDKNSEKIYDADHIEEIRRNICQNTITAYFVWNSKCFV